MMKTQKEKKIGRREFYATVLDAVNAERPRGAKLDVNPFNTKLRDALGILAEFEDGYIIGLARNTRTGRRAYYRDVMQRTKHDVNPLQKILATMLNQLGLLDDATIIRLVRGK